ANLYFHLLPSPFSRGMFNNLVSILFLPYPPSYVEYNRRKKVLKTRYYSYYLPERSGLFHNTNMNLQIENQSKFLDHNSNISYAPGRSLNLVNRSKDEEIDDANIKEKFLVENGDLPPIYRRSFRISEQLRNRQDETEETLSVSEHKTVDVN
ncbi:MAG: hypothetical protein MHPSP_001561, partial [Paramarteilia canceri]